MAQIQSTASSPGLLADPAEAGPPRAFVAGALDGIVLTAAPIKPNWVLAGAPFARSGLHSRSLDGYATTTVWDCTAGRFRWHFGWDETVVILSGAVRVTDAAGQTRLLQTGDAAFFAGGTWSVWDIDDHVRKVAFCRRTIPRPLGLLLTLRDRLARVVRASRR